MARKDLLKGLMDPPAPQADDAASPPAPAARVDAKKPRYSKGAIGAVSQSIAELKSRSVTEIDPRMIDDTGLRDRLGEDDPGDHEALVASIRDYGQQVPVLLRPNPNYPERYQVVYGRRRVAALKQLGQPVKAMIRLLDDAQVVMAQGQENAARKDLTFIEKANFARQMLDAGYERKIICDALHVDKTVISRMLSIADGVGAELIEAIGAAPNVGRDRWLKLADVLKTALPAQLIASAKGQTSDQRFEAVLADALVRVSKPRKPKPDPSIVATEDGAKLAEVRGQGGRTVLTMDKKTADGFDDWLVTALPRIHRDWLKSRGE